jgi:carbonic anhydrase/acetyltransferase-like protein (isoleucine patch superfamily)
LTCGSFSFAAHEEEKDNIDRLGSPSALETDRRVFLFSPLFADKTLKICHSLAMGDLDPQLDQFLRKQPSLGEGVYLASTAVVVGDVRIGDHSSVWYHAVLRGDINYIRVGAHTNIQDGAVVHLADEYPCEIGNWVTIGHSAVVHACEIGNECLIGMNCTILDGAVIGAQSIVGANALVTGGTQIPPGSLVLGSPAKVVRPLSEAERTDLKSWAQKYVDNGAYCLKHKLNVGAPLDTTGQ